MFTYRTCELNYWVKTSFKPESTRLSFDVPLLDQFLVRLTFHLPRKSLVFWLRITWIYMQIILLNWNSCTLLLVLVSIPHPCKRYFVDSIWQAPMKKAFPGESFGNLFPGSVRRIWRAINLLCDDFSLFLNLAPCILIVWFHSETNTVLIFTTERYRHTG